MPTKWKVISDNVESFLTRDLETMKVILGYKKCICYYQNKLLNKINVIA